MLGLISLVAGAAIEEFSKGAVLGATVYSIGKNKE